MDGLQQEEKALNETTTTTPSASASTENGLKAIRASASAQSELVRHLSAGARLLEQHRTRLLEARHAWQVGRAKLIADAERDLEQFRNRTREDLRAFDAEHSAKLQSIEHDIMRLQHMQEVAEE